MTPAEQSHGFGADLAREFVHKATAAGLDWRDVAIALETCVAIVVQAACVMQGRSYDTGLAAELIDTMTEHAQRRVAANMLGAEYKD